MPMSPASRQVKLLLALLLNGRQKSLPGFNEKEKKLDLNVDLRLTVMGFGPSVINATSCSLSSL
jgi:hypothetical protein